MTFSTYLKIYVYICASSYSYEIVSSFSQSFLEAAYSEPVEYFILPSLGQVNSKIPLTTLFQVNENKAKNPWLLHSILVLADGHPRNMLQITFTIFPILTRNPLVFPFIVTV